MAAVRREMTQAAETQLAAPTRRRRRPSVGDLCGEDAS